MSNPERSGKTGKRALMMLSCAASLMGAGGALACPTGADMDGAGVRFVGADGYDVVHRRLDANRVETTYFEAATPGDWASRSIIIHGVHVQWFANIDAQGRVEDGSATVFARETPISELPMPVVGMDWQGTYMVQETGQAPVRESIAMRAAGPTQWQVGRCTFEALEVIATATAADGYRYTETMMYLPDLGTAVLVDFLDDQGSAPYSYIDAFAVGQPASEPEDQGGVTK
ncbi:hypothetical protein [Gymnodinialimonas ulvae]|uniref:hypothetical protein n=1 Tax=Gymnodinialimonas ulvae TaxID=3126504 RepID=UPI0030B1E818